jgi:copper chaperone CopZ
MRMMVAVMGLFAILGFRPTVLAQTDKPAAGDVCTLKVQGMACNACAARVKKEALKIDGVKAAKVDQPKGTAEITFDAKKTSPPAIAKAITDKTGFKAEVAEPKR